MNTQEHEAAIREAFEEVYLRTSGPNAYVDVQRERHDAALSALLACSEERAAAAEARSAALETALRTLVTAYFDASTADEEGLSAHLPGGLRVVWATVDEAADYAHSLLASSSVPAATKTPASCTCSPGVVSAECPWHD